MNFSTAGGVPGHVHVLACSCWPKVPMSRRRQGLHLQVAVEEPVNCWESLCGVMDSLS